MWATVGGETRAGTTFSGPAGSLKGQGTDFFQHCSDELFTHCGVSQRNIAYVEMKSLHCISSYGFTPFYYASHVLELKFFHTTVSVKILVGSCVIDVITLLGQ